MHCSGLPEKGVEDIDMSLRVIVFSSGGFPKMTLSKLYELGILVGLITKPDKPQGRGQRVKPNPAKETLLELGLRDIFHVDTFRDRTLRMKLYDWIEQLKPDLGLVVDFGLFIPRGVRRRFKLILNLHPSLLPKYRGASPIERAIMAGELRTGITLAELVDKLDAGPIYWQTEVIIDPSDNRQTLSEKLDRLSANLIPQVLEGIASGQIVPVPQDDTQATYAPKISRDELKLSLSLKPGEFVNRVRALYPKAFVICDIGTRRYRLLIRSAQPVEPPIPTSEPGTFKLYRDQLILKLEEGAVRIGELQFEGRRPLKTSNLQGYKPETWKVIEG